MFWVYVCEFYVNGIIIIFIMYYFEEVEELCDEIVIISYGEVLVYEFIL